MKHINHLLTFFLLIIPIVKLFATAQIPDKLIIKEDTLSIYSNPLEQLTNIDSLREKLFGDKKGCHSTACWREYMAEWRIDNNQLYLTGIYSCCYYEDNIKANLRQLFGEKFIDGKVKADWVTANLLSPQGRQLYYVHMGYESLYEKEIVFEIKKRKFISAQTFDNSKSKQSAYSLDHEKLSRHIYSNINWNKLPKQEKTIKVFVQFSANEQGVIDSIKVLKGYNTLFDQEALRVVKTIPGWDIYYRHGKHERRVWNLPIIFSEENKRKFKQ